MIVVNDNLGVIIDEAYLNARVVCFPDEISSFEQLSTILHTKKYTLGDYGLKDRDRILKGSRTVDDSQHSKEEARLSLKIAKFNLAIDPKNRYYQEQLEKAQKNYSIYETKAS